jgi:hypothetical protein
MLLHRIIYYRYRIPSDPKTISFIGNSFSVTYWNNSPDVLHEVFFHLFQNAYQPGSYYENLTKNNHIPIKYGKYEKEGLGTTTDNIKVNGKPVKTELDNTILKVF